MVIETNASVFQRSWKSITDPRTSLIEMAVTAKNDDTSTGSTGSSEEPTLVEMFKSVLTELKDLKQTVAPLMEPVYEDEWDDPAEQYDGELPAAGVVERPPGDTGNKPTEKASGSKLLAEIVQELDISEKTEMKWMKGL